MISRVLSICAALVLAIGIAGIPTEAKSKKSSPAKKTTSRRDSKKSSKKNSRDRDARSSKKSKKDSKAASRSAKSRNRKVSKKDERSAKRVTKPRRSRDEEEEKYAPSRPSAVVRPSTVIAGGDAALSEGEDPDAPPAPRPANRVVADISSARVIQIQNALIREGLMTGPANGVYDQATFSAMSSFQSRKGYKPLGVPTADSLKALGVPKNSGRTYMSASRVLESTAPRQEQ